MVAVGVAVWPAWGAWFLAGDAPSVGWPLAVHLALVVPGGAILRAHRPPEARRSRGRRLGEVLILLGVAAWVPYFLLGGEDEGLAVGPFLAAHLSGVIPGSVLRYTPIGDRLFSRARPAAEAPAPRGT